MDRGNLALGSGDCALAAEFFSKAVGSAASSGKGDQLLALKGLANALTLAERHAEAAKVYRRLAELDPADPTNRFNLAVALTRVRLFSQAEAIYLQLLAEQADFLQARYNLAALYRAEGKLAQARDQWRQVVRQAPQLASAHGALGEVLLTLGNAREAMTAYATAAELVGDDAKLWCGLATAAWAAGRPHEAATAARRAVELADQDPVAWRLLGDVLLDLHRATGDKEYLAGATAAWRQSLALDGSQADLQRALDAMAGTAVQPLQAVSSRPSVDN